MIRCVRMWTGEDGDSLFEEGWIDLSQGVRGDAIGEPVPVAELSFQETRSGGSYEWHQDPAPRFVITLSGADDSIVALLGASPGASTSAYIAFQVLEKCFKKELAGGWRDRLKTIIPTYGIDLTQDAVATRDIRTQTATVLKLDNV